MSLERFTVWYKCHRGAEGPHLSCGGAVLNKPCAVTSVMIYLHRVSFTVPRFYYPQGWLLFSWTSLLNHNKSALKALEVFMKNICAPIKQCEAGKPQNHQESRFSGFYLRLNEKA